MKPLPFGSLQNKTEEQSLFTSRIPRSGSAAFVSLSSWMISPALGPSPILTEEWAALREGGA